MSAMVQIFSWGERWKVLFNVAKPNENICTIGRMKNIHHLLYITSKIICHLEQLIILHILENEILFWSRHFTSKVTAANHSTLNWTIARCYLMMTSQFVEWSLYMPIYNSAIWLLRSNISRRKTRFQWNSSNQSKEKPPLSNQYAKCIFTTKVYLDELQNASNYTSWMV